MSGGQATLWEVAAFTEHTNPGILRPPILVMAAPGNYSPDPILPQPDQAKAILPIQGGGGRVAKLDAQGDHIKGANGKTVMTNNSVESVETNLRDSAQIKGPGAKGPKLVKLEKGFRVRYPDDSIKDEIMELVFTAEEERLFEDYLKFDKAFVKRYILNSDQSKQDFYDFWKLFVEKDGTDGYTLMTKTEGKKLQSYMEEIVYAHREYLIQSALRLLRKQDNPEHFEEVLNPEPKEEGFIFAEVKPRELPVEPEPEPELSKEEEEDDGDSDFEPDEEDEEDEDEEDEEDEDDEEDNTSVKPAKNTEFKELVKLLGGREAGEKKLENAFQYLMDTFPKDKYIHFKQLMGIMRGSHFDISHGRIKVESFFDLFREERDENTLSFGSLLNLLVRIDIKSIKNLDLQENFKEFFKTHIFNDPSGIKYKDRVIGYIEGKY